MQFRIHKASQCLQLLLNNIVPKYACLDCGIPTDRSRCSKCFAARELSKPIQKKESSTARGYDSKWQRIRLTILHRDNWLCHYCGKQLAGSDATVDHLIPLSHNGERLSATNLVASCRSCNSRKKNKII